MSVATNVRKHRLPWRLTQEAMAALVGKNRVTITEYELGQIDIPLSGLADLAKASRGPVGKWLVHADSPVGAKP